MCTSGEKVKHNNRITKTVDKQTSCQKYVESKDLLVESSDFLKRG